MHVYHELTIFVDDEPVVTDWPKLTVGQILDLAGKPGFRLKCLDTDTEFFGFNVEILLRHGLRFMTPNGPHHTYDLKRAGQAWRQSDKLP
jgi:hypothetical protein